MDFLGHGKIEIKQENDIVMVKFIGSINLETYMEYSNRIFEIAKEYNGKRWAEIHDYREWELSPPEVHEEAVRAEKNPEKLNYRCTDIVVIIEESIAKKQAQMQSQNEIFLQPDYVTTVGEAIELLRSKGYRAKS